MGIAAALLVFFMMKLPSGLVPQEDQGMFMVEVDAPEGYTLEQTYDLLQQVEEKVKVIPEMESYAMVSGYGLISGQGSNTSPIMSISSPPLSTRCWNCRRVRARRADVLIP